MDGGARCHRLGDLPPNNTLGLGGILYLVTDGDLLSQPDQPSQVLVQRFCGDARKRHPGGGPVVSRGERQPEESGSLLGVTEEEFVKIAHPEEDESVPVLGLHLSPLAHQWSIVSLWHLTQGYLPAGTRSTEHRTRKTSHVDIRDWMT